MPDCDGLDNNFEGSTDDEVALMSRKFKEMMKKKRKFQHPSRQKDTRFKRKQNEENNEIICFKCKKLCHMKTKCPQLKRKGHS